LGGLLPKKKIIPQPNFRKANKLGGPQEPFTFPKLISNRPIPSYSLGWKKPFPGRDFHWGKGLSRKNWPDLRRIAFSEFEWVVHPFRFGRGTSFQGKNLIGIAGVPKKF